MATGIFIGGRGYHLSEVSPNAVTLSREEHAIIRMTGCSIAAFTKARAKRLAGVDPISGKAVPDVGQPALQPYPPEDAGDDEDDDGTEWMLKTGAAGVKFPATVTYRRSDGSVGRRKAER